MAQPRTIAVAHASIGSGHRIAAEAIAAEITAKSEGAVRAELFDVLEHASPRLSGDLLTSTFTGPTAGVYDFVWSSPSLGAAGRALITPVLDAMLKAFTSRLEEIGADEVVCTHAMAAAVTARAVRRQRAAYHVTCVATDFGMHGFWPREGVERFCVASDRSAETLAARGISGERIAVTGIPVRRQFALEYDREAARRHFELPQDRRVVLALAGSMMPGPYERFKEALAVSLPALASLPLTDVAIVTGRDEQFAEEMRARSAGFGTTNVHIFGYVEHMAPLMACADLALGKPGGQVCAESLSAGVPLVLIGPAAGQESANARAMTDAGAAVFAADPRTIAEYVRKVVSKPARLKAMRTAAVAHARPFAAGDVAELVIGAAAD